MNWLHAVLLGIVEGITEFLPVSSTGHLNIVEKLLGYEINSAGMTAFTAVIQVGAILAAIIYFWADIVRIVTAWFKGLSNKQARQDPDYTLGWGIILGSIPVAVVGLLLKDFIDNDQFGEIYYAKTTYLRRKGFPGGWFGDKARSGGGPLIDLGVHVIDLTRYLMGRPQPVSVYGATFSKLGARENIKSGVGYLSESREEGKKDIFNVEDMATAMVRYDNGAVLQVEASFSLNAKGSGTTQLFGTKAGASLDGDKLEIYNEYNGYMGNVTLADVPTDFGNAFDKEINHFVDCILTGIPCRNPAEDGVTLMKILDAIYESARTGHEVVLK